MKLNLSARPQLADMIPLSPEAAEPIGESTFELEARGEPHDEAYFDGRPGFDTRFIPDFEIQFPSIAETHVGDVLTFSESMERFDYQHFSIQMSRSRKLAIFTAVNIDGGTRIVIKRGRDRWHLDDRAGIDGQHGEGLYAGNALDRGHLVRRADPAWGTRNAAQLANDDTFHFTNCAPQMAAMNQRTWLSLEDYILEGASIAGDRISVFTGPVFSQNDLLYRGVQIPLAYWKVVAFVHDNGRPSATGYMVSQSKELVDLEAAFGRFRTYQRSIRYIESITNLDFGRLRDFDGFSNEELARGGAFERILEGTSDIRV